MAETVTIELNGQKFEIDIAKMSAIIDDLSKKWDMSTVQRSMKNGDYTKAIERIAKRKFEEDRPTDVQKMKIIAEMV